jgi:hypothetical protein
MNRIVAGVAAVVKEKLKDGHLIIIKYSAED